MVPQINRNQYILFQLLVRRYKGESAKRYRTRLEEKVQAVAETLEEKFDQGYSEYDFQCIYNSNSCVDQQDYTFIYRRDISHHQPLTEEQISKVMESFRRKKGYRGLRYKIGFFEGRPVTVSDYISFSGDFGHDEGHPQDRD